MNGCGSPRFSRPCDRGGFGLRLTLSSLPDYACLDVYLPRSAASWTVNQLLDHLFPPSEQEQAEIEETFDLAENPDLPEIYQGFVEVISQFRRGFCHLAAAGDDGANVEVEATVSSVFEGIEDVGAEEGAVLPLRLIPQYSALAYASRMGWNGGEPEVLEWLQECVALYFIDKHEATIPVVTPAEDEEPLGSVVSGLRKKGLVSLSEPGNQTAITEEGRTFIGRLLRETEGYIDRYDIFNDVLWEPESGSVEFGTGHGEDLRVEVFIYQGVDPLRAVFLLRLYDGTLDEFANEWREYVGKASFYDYILEPVVNRCVINEEFLEAAIEGGFAKLEEAAEAARESRIFDRVFGGSKYSPY